MVVSVRLAPKRMRFWVTVAKSSSSVWNHADRQALVGPLCAGFALGSRGPPRWRHHGGPPGLARGLVVIIEQERASAWRMPSTATLTCRGRHERAPARSTGAQSGGRRGPRSSGSKGALHGRQTLIRADGPLGRGSPQTHSCGPHRPHRAPRPPRCAAYRGYTAAACR